MTELEKRAVRALADVQANRYDSPYILTFVSRLKLFPEHPLEEEPGTRLWALAWRYRRQIADEEVLKQAALAAANTSRKARAKEKPPTLFDKAS